MWRLRSAFASSFAGRFTWVIALLWLCLRASPSAAASRDARERSARTACLAGNYAKGITILSELFVETNDATYIYNQGRCLEQNARYTEAIARFQEYLGVGRKLTAGDKADTQKHIAACESMLAKQQQPGVVAGPEATQGVVVASPSPTFPQTVASPPVERAVASQPQDVRLPGRGLRTAGIVVAGVGGAALVAGVILNLKVNAMANDFRNVNGYTDAKESDRKTYEALGWTSYGVGAACVATGAVLYLLGYRAGQEQSPTVAASVSSSGVIAELQGRF
jgi:hypothetical protein